MNPKLFNFWEARQHEQALEAQALSSKPWLTAIPLFEGRPERDTIINDDDIINLKIALGSSNSLESFLEVV